MYNLRVNALHEYVFLFVPAGCRKIFVLKTVLCVFALSIRERLCERWHQTRQRIIMSRYSVEFMNIYQSTPANIHMCRRCKERKEVFLRRTSDSTHILIFSSLLFYICLFFNSITLFQWGFVLTAAATKTLLLFNAQKRKSCFETARQAQRSPTNYKLHVFSFSVTKNRVLGSWLPENKTLYFPLYCSGYQ